MQFEVLSDAGGLEEEWWDLWRRDAAATPFQSPAWLLPWRRSFSGGDTQILTLRDGGRLAAVLPLFRHEERLLPWGAGTTDRLDGAFAPDLDIAAVSQGLARLASPVDLFQLPAGSPLLRMPVPDGWSARTGFAESCAVLSLPASFSSRVAQNLRYYRRRAERAGAGLPRRGTPDDFEALAELHTRRWRERGEPGIFADPRMVAWQRQALPQLEAAGLLQLHVIELDARVVAALCVLCAKRRAYYFIGGFDPDHAALGLGTILVGHAVAEAERLGMTSFDFLRGQEPYKYRWGAQDQPTHARQFLPPHREHRQGR
jgi:Protein involved in cellulose biosynthesis (CelD)